ncbi:hypothetical protein [Changpingibacter yushuensis]|uniref:hypothetical protein n=1 Tax=Changpingibacter yushuensis TaxID=2758440 RepID=UPI0015F6E862|nr:hypothetical protein [Changpingibacter yushuensis]
MSAKHASPTKPTYEQLEAENAQLRHDRKLDREQIGLITRDSDLMRQELDRRRARDAALKGIEEDSRAFLQFLELHDQYV